MLNCSIDLKVKHNFYLKRTFNNDFKVPFNTANEYSSLLSKNNYGCCELKYIFIMSPTIIIIKEIEGMDGAQKLKPKLFAWKKMRMSCASKRLITEFLHYCITCISSEQSE